MNALWHDGLSLGERVKAGDLTAVEAVEAAIHRIESANDTLNAVVTKIYDQALDAAKSATVDGPFAGVPFLLKDLGGALADVPFTGGSRFFRDDCPPTDSVLVQRYKSAGLIPLGRTNTPEFGLNASTEPVLFGATHNPWDITKSPGGSSGGSAASVSAGFVPLAHASDGGRVDPYSSLVLWRFWYEDNPGTQYDGPLSRREFGGLFCRARRLKKCARQCSCS